MILASQANEFLIVAIIAIMVIAVALLIYYIITGKKKKVDVQITPNFESKNIIPDNKPVIKEPVKEIPVKQIEIKEEKPAEEEKKKILEEEKTDNNIQILLNQMQQDLNKSNKEDYSESISRYEDDEEANAIISYKELMKYKESSEKNLVLNDKNKEEIKEVIKEDNKLDNKEEIKKFRRSEFISPIFGYNEDTNVTYREIKRPPKKESKTSNSEWESDGALSDLASDTAEVIEFEEKGKSDENDKFLDELVDFRNKLN